MGDVTDPVCGVQFPEEGAEELGALKLEHAGATRWFCCPTCRDAFAKDPARYLQRPDHSR